MANKIWTHLKLKNGDMVQFAPPAPNGALLGGISLEEKNKIQNTEAMIAEVYNPTKAEGYAVGEYCIKDGSLYRCKTAIAAGGEEWNPAHWDEVDVSDELASLSSSVEQISQKLPVIDDEEPVGMQEGLFVDIDDPNPDYNIFDKVDELTASVASITPTLAKSAETTFTLVANETRVVTGQPTALNVTLAAPAADKDSMYSLMFKAGASFALTDTAPTGYSIVWGDEPTWTEGTVYEIIYRYLHLDGIISAKYAEAVVEVSV